MELATVVGTGLADPRKEDDPGMLVVEPIAGTSVLKVEEVVSLWVLSPSSCRVYPSPYFNLREIWIWTECRVIIEKSDDSKVDDPVRL